MIDVQQFLDEAAGLERNGLWPWFDFESQGMSKDDALLKLSGWESWKETSEDIKASVKDDCKCVMLFSQLMQKTHNSTAWMT
jgi:hypothetical protein